MGPLVRCPLLLASALVIVGSPSPEVRAQTGGDRQQMLLAAFQEVDRDLTESVSAELSVHQGVLAYQQDQFADALATLRNSGSERLAAQYYKGLALIRLDRPEEAAPILNALRNNPRVPRVIDLGIAEALYASGYNADADEMLQEYSQEFPEDQEATDLLLNPPTASPPPATVPEQPTTYQRTAAPPLPPPRNWNLTFLTGYDYDSNVVRAPTFQGLGSGIRREDSSWITALFGDYRFIQEDDLVVGAIGSVFYADRFELNRLDTANFVGGGYFNRAVGDVILGANYQFNETLLGGDQFAAEHRLVTSVSYLEGDFGHTTAYYEYDDADVEAPALIPAQVQSAHTNALGVTQAVYLYEGAGRFFAGYRYANNTAEGTDFSFRSHMVTARVEVPVNGHGWAADWLLDAEVRVFFDDYDNPNGLDFFGRARDDTRTVVRTGAQKFLTEHVSLRLDYTFVNSDSNVANLFGVQFYEFDRHNLTAQFIYDF